VPASLRQELQKLDPATVRGAIERALAGDNESARVSAVKLLSDVDAFSRDGGCPDCAAAAVEARGARERLDTFLLGVVESVLRCLLMTGEPDKTAPRIVRLTLERIQADERLGQAAELLASARSVEAEVERRTRERTLERDDAIVARDEALARLAEFTGSPAGA
jgi:hypothetical protein